MEQNILSELEDELNHIDVDSIKLDAIIQLKTWQKKMYSLIDKTYKNRMHEIDSITTNLTNEIKEKQNQIENLQIHDKKIFHQLKNDIDSLKSNIKIDESIPENFEHRIQRTVRVTREEENHDEELVDVDDDDVDDDDDEPVIVDIDRHDIRVGDKVVLVVAAPQQSSMRNEEGQVSRILNSQPVQHALAVGLVKTLTQMGVIAATSTTTAAATTMAKTAIIATVCSVGTVAYGVGRIAMGTTRKVWSFVVSSDD
jgi:chromosome segregation ATPase